ncbi:hypothetical protein J2T60_000495 [Natronospira proteinivora]|uniref:Pyrroloquinoline quinone biosynthesis protein PqqE n=1 Tax=Natronospira proteinivora TaxID=1807133 RepID=A0ABT1G5G9_9GAMM|nr:hypothetical protein [Natronospira proteinivora]MCP1726530.1 hypothetical protein [Natronospira proteinivora]
MEIGNSFSNGAQAIQRAEVGMTASARTIASASTSSTQASQSQPQEITDALVGNISYEAQAAAGVRVVESASESQEALGQLIDTRA